MGLFGNDDSDSEKSFRERVGDIQDEMEGRVEEAKGEVSENDINDEIKQLAANAQGSNVEPKKLAKAGSGIFDVGYLSQRPIIAYLENDEQPHYHFVNTTKGIACDGNKIEAGNTYHNSMIITDQRIHFFAAADSGDHHEVIDHQNVDSVDIDFGGRYPKFVITAGSEEYRFITRRQDKKEIRGAQQYMSNPSENQLDLRLQAEPVNEIQQWEYKTINLLNESESGIMGSWQEQASGPPLPSDELLNRLGKEGWKLVETVERPAMEDAALTNADNGGSMTYAFVFRRPVSYPNGSDQDRE